MTQHRIWVLCIVLGGFAPVRQPAAAQFIFPQKHWQQYTDPAQAGWSVKKLAQAGQYADSIHLAATLIIYKGAVLASWGDIERKYLCHSMRKSFLSALYGLAIHEGVINKQATLEQLGIDDRVHPLTVAEKQATVQDLLQARSGIYLPAAYEGNPQKPPRGSHPPGSFWFYNNWDFNALGTILEQKTGRRFFADLQQRLAVPLQMEDVDSLDVFYKYEPERSQYPAYTFKMSTRDLARFGLLYLAGGKWNAQPLLPASWIQESIQPYSVNDEGEGYGYLWWIDQTLFKERGMYSAAGMSGHHIFIFPKDSLLVVVRADTYTDTFVDLKSEYQLLTKILGAKTAPTAAQPALQRLPALTSPPMPNPSLSVDQRRYVGRFQFADEWMHVLPGKKGLLMDTQYMGKFHLLPCTESVFLLKDQQTYISFLFDKAGKAVKLIYHERSKLSVKNE